MNRIFYFVPVTMRKKIMITGANGFLGYYLVKQLLSDGFDVIATGKGACRLPLEKFPGLIYQALDFTDETAVDKVMKTYLPDIVIHSGAMSKPDECELNKDKAYLVNVVGTKNLLNLAMKRQCFFLFVSTDFVFDGEKGMYCEDDLPNPVNYYGKTKHIAENEVMNFASDWAIVRTVLVYGKPMYGRNNILTIVKEKLEQGETYKVVTDQVRTPTYVGDLSLGIAAIISSRSTGIYHISGKDILTPFEMAKETARYLGLNENLLEPVSENIFSQPAQRPLKTGFSIVKANAVLGFHPISFIEGLQKTFSDK